MRDVFFDLETFSRLNLKLTGSHKYARDCEVMLFAFADGDGAIYVWDCVHNEIWWEDELSGAWECRHLDTGMPPNELQALLDDKDVLWFAHNSGQFDFPVLDNQMPEIAGRMEPARRRDTMVQAFAHALPGALEKLGDILGMTEDKKKLKDGKALVRLLCLPQNEAFQKKFCTDRATRETHPAEWMRFIQYAGGDITTMREARRRLPKWNYSTPKQIELCLIDWKINARGFQVDTVLAEKAVVGADIAKALLAKQSKELTDDQIGATTQRDALLAFILAEHGVELPDMRADTLERRIDDPSLPDAVRDLLKNRLQASMNSVTKFKTLLRMVCDDGRMRGCMQFRGAGRTGRWAHRGVQPGNLPRPNLPHKLVEFAIWALKADDVELIDLVLGNVMQAISNTIRGAIVAPPGKKLVIADLANIEGRMAAWLAGEEWKLQAFRDYDTIIGKDEKGKDVRKGWDLYILAYANSFNVPPQSVPPKGNERQIGKVEELMFQYGGGVGAWITGAATYGIDLDAMTEAVHGTVPKWALGEAEGFLQWLCEKAEAKFDKRMAKADAANDVEVVKDLLRQIGEERTKARYGLSEKVFVTCDAIKRLWRKAHPQISSYWKELEEAVRFAIANPGVTIDCRKLKVRRKGGWLRIVLPSGRALCYPEPRIEGGSITYTGLNQYTRQWGRVKTYGGKLFENCIAAGTEVLTDCGWMKIENVTLKQRIWDGFEFVAHSGSVYKGNQVRITTFGVSMTPDHLVLTTEGWRNASSCEGHHRAPCWLPDGALLPRQRRAEIAMGCAVRLWESDFSRRVRAEEEREPQSPSVVRLHAQSDDQRTTNAPRDVWAPRVLGVAKHDRSVHAANPPVVAQLRWAWHQGMQAVAGTVRELLDGHGRHVPKRTHVGTRKQFQGIQQRELCVANDAGAEPQPAHQQTRPHPRGQDDPFISSGTLRCEVHDAALSPQQKLASGESFGSVYDILNCGPRQRFVVRGRDGRALIVHNCVQAASCDQFAEPMPSIEQHEFELVLGIHDEHVAEAPVDRDDLSAELLGNLMCMPLDWNKGLPLAAAGFEADRYRKE